MPFHTLKRQKDAVNPPETRLHPQLGELATPHIESFNTLFSHGSAMGLLDRALLDIPHMVVFDGLKTDRIDERNKLQMWVSSAAVAKPMLNELVYPSECRERGASYKAKMQLKLNWSVNGGPVSSSVKSLGYLPIMVKSTKCNLDAKSPRQLVEHHEDPDEFGGYFISNGIERLIRLLIVPRRNHPTAIIRPSFQNRGHTYSPYGVQMRCVRPDQTSQTVTIHYCTDGAVTLRFSYRKNEYMVPILLVLRSLCDASDLEIFERLTMGYSDNTFLVDRVEMLIRSFQRYTIYTRSAALDYLGSKFAVMIDSPEDSNNEQVGVEFLKRVILVHLKDSRAKFDMLIFMMQKLYSLVEGTYGADNPDSLQFQETLLPGHLFLSIIKEKVSDWLGAIKIQILTDLRRNKSVVDFKDRKSMLI